MQYKLPPCLIMAGGRGSRLGFITNNTPKPIIKINNKPFLIYLIRWLEKNGIKKFYFLTSYKNNKIEKFLKSYFLKSKCKYKLFRDQRRSGTFPAILNHLSKIENSFFYSNADEVSNFNIKKIYKNFRKSKTNIMCAVIKSKKGKLSLDKKNSLINIKKGEKNSYKDCGFKFINKKIFKTINKKKYEKIEDFIYAEYIKNNRVSFFEIKKLPLRIDTSLDIKRAKRGLLNAK